MVVAAGTGTVCVARGPQRWAKVDGWGSLLGDDGSGFAIGRPRPRLGTARARRAGRLAGAAGARRGERFGEPGEMAEADLPLAGRRPAPWPSFARDVAQEAAQGDAAARSILEDAGRELAVTACAALERALRPRRGGRGVVLGKRLLSGRAAARLVHRKSCGAARPDAELVAPQGDSLAGAALLAELAAELHAGPRACSGAPREPARGCAAGSWCRCRRAPGSPLARPETMSAMARAAELGGAVGIRAEGPADIRGHQGRGGRAGDRPGQARPAGLAGPHHAEPRRRAGRGRRRRRRGGGRRDAAHAPRRHATRTTS